ncbi:NADP-dependent oxidoreductase [Yoonia sp.]|uniref:NADP-dependent oxidoreductase n=1 Tax=Yoonia sp. TaxID=2212373 RepID=UPI003975919D
MKAATISDYNAAIEITEIDKPVLKADSVLIKVHAASLNPIDNILRSGAMKEAMPLSFPHVMGFDVAGEVVEIGKDVANVKVGDAVFARPNQEDAGAIAELAHVKESELALKPANLSYAQAACVPLAGLTAWQALLTKGHLKKGDKVLIHAGSGGVGTFAIQIAKHVGAYVATTVSTKNIEVVKTLGADKVIDYTAQQFEDEISDYDLVFDMIGGDTLDRSFKVLKKGGTMISIKGQDSAGLAKKHGVRFETLWMEPDGAMLAELGTLLSKGIVKTVTDSTFSMDEVDAAYAQLAKGHAVGKIVVEVGE